MPHTKKHLSSLKERFVPQSFRVLRNLYYRLAFGRQFPFSGKLTSWIRTWEEKLRKGDVPLAQESWNASYSAGNWDYLKGIGEVARNGVIAGYLRYVKSDGSIFDIGCGEGALFQLIRGTAFSKYIGLDVSAVAIDKLTSQQYEKCQFISADAESYAPTEEVDAIVFGDSLYYFQDPLAAVERYSRVLKQNGMMVVSAYAGSARAMAILRLVKGRYDVFEEVEITRKGQSCTVSVFMKT